MIVMLPVDTKYKGQVYKAHTKFNCDSSDFKRLQSLGAWAIRSTEPKNKRNSEGV